MKYKLEVLINKPRNEVWRAFGDRETVEKWQPTLTGIEPVQGTPGYSGAQSKWMYEENGREFSLIETVLHREEPTRFENLFENAFASSTVNNLFLEQGPEVTLWIEEVTYTFKTLLMKILGPLFKRNYAARSRLEMQRFKEMLEAGQPQSQE